ncbi:MAG: hypothetical protein R3C26_02335 [Calditrichia bacterium]
MRNRKTRVANWYLDMTMLMNYWGGSRTYHHTAPINMITPSAKPTLGVVAEEEGLEARWQRHRETAEQFWSGLEEMGLHCHVAGKPARQPHDRKNSRWRKRKRCSAPTARKNSISDCRSWANSAAKCGASG